MGRKNQKKLQLAYSFLSSVINRGDFSERRFFPSAESLAGMAGVSASTMLKAVNVLKKEGKLAGAHRRRVTLSGRVADAAARNVDTVRRPPVRRTKRLVLQAEIQRDILNGRYRHDAPMPPEKELTARYGVSRMTLRAALLALTDQGFLRRRGPRFSAVSLAGSPYLPRQRIVLLGQGNNMGYNITWGYWRQENLKLLEVECARAGISLDVACFGRNDAGLRIIDGYSWQPVDINDRSGVMGYIYLMPGDGSKDEELLKTLAHSNLPVAIFDEVGNWPSPAFLKQHSNLRVFRNTVGDTAALQVARFVLELGHRSAVYISPFHQWEYSVRRLDGLTRAFSAIEGARIVSIVSEESEGDAKVDLQRMTGFHEAWTRTLPLAYAVPLERHFGLLSSVVGEGAIHNGLQPLFERAWAVNDATAWIAVNDTCADAALEFTKQKKIQAPGRLSIMSFDDLPVALTNGISSYNFNYPAVMISMLRFITHPRLFPVSRPVIEIEGNVVPRRTTGRPGMRPASRPAH